MHKHASTLISIMFQNKCLDLVGDHCQQHLRKLLTTNKFSDALNILSDIEKEFSNNVVMLQYFNSLTNAVYVDEQERILTCIVDKLNLLKTQLNAQKLQGSDNFDFSVLASCVTVINEIISQLNTPFFSKDFSHDICLLRKSFNSGKILDYVVLNSILDFVQKDIKIFIDVRNSLALHQ